MLMKFLVPCLLAACLAQGQLPYAVSPVDDAPATFELTRDGTSHGVASLAWDRQGLRLTATIRDSTPLPLDAVDITIADAYRADSIEIWVNRHQFVLADTPYGLALYDYLYQEPVATSSGEIIHTEEQYEVMAHLPWSVIGLDPRPGSTFQVAIQINDRRQIASPDGKWKERVVQTLFPEQAVWDRPSTYGTVYLQQGPLPAGTSASPVPLAILNLRALAYAKQTEAYVHRTPHFANAPMILRLLDPDNAVFAEFDVPAGAGEQRLILPWNEARTGIFSAALYLVDGEQLLGPVAEPYFNAGSVPIADYRSDRQPPEDLREFWTASVTAMRQRPFSAESLPFDSPWPAIEVRKVRLANHRGNPMIVYLSRHTEDTGALPAHLNVYPPMRADAPVKPRRGAIGLTFSGSLQGQCRLPEQSADEGLWARAESLADSYWLDVVLDAVRALDYLAAQEESDGKATVSGGSRGGWYAMAIAAVAPDRLRLARFTSPCYADVTMNMHLGYGSAATEIYSVFTRDRVRTDGRIFATFRYFDPLFLASLIRMPVIFSAGLQDNICSAIGMTAAAHNIPPGHAYFLLDPEAGHGGSPQLSPFIQSLVDSIP